MRNKYFLLRHGEVQKEEGTIYDWPSLHSYPITEKGKKDIESVAQELRNKKIDLIYSSDSLRTRQTSEILAKELKIKINFDSGLRDINLGVYQGRKKEEFYRDFPENLERFSKKVPKGESWHEVRKRVVSFLKDIEKKHKRKNILVVSHGDFLWLLEGVIRGWSNEELFRERDNLIKMGEFRELNTKNL